LYDFGAEFIQPGKPYFAAAISAKHNLEGHTAQARIEKEYSLLLDGHGNATSATKLTWFSHLSPVNLE
jgi:hypothetical protein